MTSLAFAGAGWITAIHGLAADAVPDLRVVHVASRRGLSASRRAEQTGAVVCRYDDLPGGADAVLVATPPAQHRREAERAVEGGALALVETPLAATLVDADALVALAGRGRVAYAENLVHSPAVAEAVSACRRIGALTHLEVRFAQGRPDWSEHRHDPSWGGGAFFDLGVHAVAVALLMAAPARVVAVEKAELTSGARLEVDDDATVTLAFDTGLRAEVRATWRAAAPTWDAQAASATGAVRLELVPDPSVEINGAPLRIPPAPSQCRQPAAAPPRLHRPARGPGRGRRVGPAAAVERGVRPARARGRLRRLRGGRHRRPGSPPLRRPPGPHAARDLATIEPRPG